MSGGKFCRSRELGAILQSKFWLTARITAFCLFAAALFGISGCGQNEPVQKIAPVTIKRPTPQPAAMSNQESLPTELQSVGSGVTAWADKFRGQLIAGLDGKLYVPYKSTTIERVQRALSDRGLYTGPANGVLDRPTMKSIFEFQEANYNLQRCGIPTPRTRSMLQQGSHTDLTS